MQQQKSGCDKQEIQGKYEKRIKALKWTTYGYHFDFENEMYGPQHHCNSGSTPGVLMTINGTAKYPQLLQH